VTRVRVRRQALEELEALPSIQLKQRAYELLQKLEARPSLGLPLSYLPQTGDLRGCRKLYLGQAKDVAPTHRIVYRLVPDEGRPTEVDVIAVGERADYEAYKRAVTRLHRISR
jgi:hypothetical protein